MSAQLDYRAIRKRAEEEFQRQKRTMRVVFFAVNLVMFIVFMGISWNLFLSNGGVLPTSDGQPDNPLTSAMVMLSTISFLGVLFQFISLIMESKYGGHRMRDRAMGRALTEEMMRLGEEMGEVPEKPKHTMQLTNDGELEEIVEDDDQAVVEAAIKRQARRRR